MHLLIVDDDTLWLRAMQRRAEQLHPDWTVHVASGGTHALSLLGANPVDLVMCDWHLGHHDGFNLLGVVAQHDRAPAMLLVSAAEELPEPRPGVRVLSKLRGSDALFRALDDELAERRRAY